MGTGRMRGETENSNNGERNDFHISGTGTGMVRADFSNYEYGKCTGSFWYKIRIYRREIYGICTILFIWSCLTFCIKILKMCWFTLSFYFHHPTIINLKYLIVVLKRMRGGYVSFNFLEIYSIVKNRKSTIFPLNLKTELENTVNLHRHFCESSINCIQSTMQNSI